MQTVPKIVCEPKKLETEGAELEALKVSPVAYVAKMAILVMKNYDNDLYIEIFFLFRISCVTHNSNVVAVYDGHRAVIQVHLKYKSSVFSPQVQGQVH